MKVLILYFSGTGNTAYVGKYLKEHLSRAKVEVYTASIESIDKTTIEQYDHLIFGFPIFACDMPLFVKNYLKELPLTKYKTVFLYCTKAIASGAALIHAQEIFERKGYAVLGVADINMPGSDGLAFIKKDASMIKKIQKRNFQNLPEVDFIVERLMKVQKSIEIGEDLNQYTIDSKIGFGNKMVGQIMSKTYPLFENKLKNKFWANDNCIKCKKCEKICPSNNIKVKEKVEFDNKCYLCMRCIHQCPVEAIQIGRKTEGKFRWKGPDGTFNPLKELKIN